MVNFDKRREILTSVQVAEYLKIDKVTLYRLVKTGQIPAFKIGRQWRFNAQDIENLTVRMNNSSAAKEEIHVRDTTFQKEDP